MKIEINGKEYGFQWGMGAVEIYCDMMGCDVDGLGLGLMAETEIKRQKSITTLVLAAIQNWCELNSIDFDLNYRKLQAWLSDQQQGVADTIIADWKKSMYYGKTIGEWYFGEVPTEEAKPSQKKRKSPSVKS